MGLLDSVVGSVLGGAQSGGAGGLDGGGLASVLGELLGNDGAHGGLDGLFAKFNQAGLGPLIASWIGSGANLPVSGDQLHDVLGRDAMSGMAQRMGIDPGQLAGQLAQVLPGLIDQLTPHGQAPAGGLGSSGDLMGSLLGSLLKGR